jgi:hypothetical protein
LNEFEECSDPDIVAQVREVAAKYLLGELEVVSPVWATVTEYVNSSTGNNVFPSGMVKLKCGLILTTNMFVALPNMYKYQLRQAAAIQKAFDNTPKIPPLTPAQITWLAAEEAKDLARKQPTT